MTIDDSSKKTENDTETKAKAKPATKRPPKKKPAPRKPSAEKQQEKKSPEKATTIEKKAPVKKPKRPQQRKPAQKQTPSVVKGADDNQNSQTTAPAKPAETSTKPPERKKNTRPKKQPKKPSAKIEPVEQIAPPASTPGETAAKPTPSAPSSKKPHHKHKKQPNKYSAPQKTEQQPTPATEPSPAPEKTTTNQPQHANDHKKPHHKNQAQRDSHPKKPTAPSAPVPSQATAPASSVKLLINAEEPEECRVALLENGKLESFHVETVSLQKNKGNIYKGKIVSIEENLQVAFVDFGTGKNGFLAFGEIHPEYYAIDVPPDTHYKDLKIKNVLKEGQELLVEVVKEVTGTKGANLTTYISLPGRYVVLMPGSDSHGISRQIDKPEEREKLREMLASCSIPEGVGYIIRTASIGATKTALTQDVRFQVKLWKEIKNRGQELPAPSLVYQEQDIVGRFLRDHFSPEIQEILVDDKDAHRQVLSFMNLLPAAQKNKTIVKLHNGPRPLLNSYNIEEQIEQIYKPTVKLPSGGSIVINPTEALVAIDVNSGSTRKDKNFEKTIFLANMEAAEELARQLRLRDLGGLIVVDFIDMRSMANTKEVERKVKASMKRDKAKVDFTRISKFGLMQISRQRMGASVEAGNYVTCDHCNGRGTVRSVETQALAYLRQIQTGVTRKNVGSVHCKLPVEVGQYLLNKKRADLAEMEKRYRVTIAVETDPTLKPSQARINFLKEG